MEKVKKEKSIIGQINDMSHKLVFLLVIPIFISLVLMLVYAAKYNNAIARMETIASLKNVVSEEIPGNVWNIVSGRDTIRESGIYATVHNVEDTIEAVTADTGPENSLSLVIAGRTMKTLENYVDMIRDNIEAEVPVVENEEILNEIRDVSTLVDSMLNEYIAGEIASTGRMSLTLRPIIFATALAECVIVVLALIIRNQSMKKTANFVRGPIESLEQVSERLAEGALEARIPATEDTELRNLTIQVNTMADRLETITDKSIWPFPSYEDLLFEV